MPRYRLLIEYDGRPFHGFQAQADLPSVADVCDGASRCRAYTLVLKEAGLTQLQTVFLGAAVCCVVAGLVALVVLRAADTRAIPAGRSGTGVG